MVLDLDTNDELDITSLEALAKLAAKLHKRQIIWPSPTCTDRPRAVAEDAGLLDAIGEDHVFANLGSRRGLGRGASPAPAHLTAAVRARPCLGGMDEPGPLDASTGS